MIEQGLIEEVKQILAKYDTFPTAMQGLGYKEVVEYLEGILTKEEMINIYAMMQFPRVFSSNGTFSCPLRKYCQNKPCGFHKQKVDKRCLTQPWTRMRKWNRCYFNTWWYFKGFKNLIIR